MDFWKKVAEDHFYGLFSMGNRMVITNLHVVWHHGFGPWSTRDVWRHTIRMIFMAPWSKSMMLASYRDITQLTKLGSVNTKNRPALFEEHANASCAPIEPLFTPLWPWTAVKKTICTKKRILRESSVNLRYLIIKQHVLTSEIEKSRTSWSRSGLLYR